MHRQTDSAVSSMPFRMDIHPHVLRHSGLSEIEIDGVREVLRRFDEAGAATVVNVALLAVAALGTQVAAQSPFAATA